MNSNLGHNNMNYIKYHRNELINQRTKFIRKQLELFTLQIMKEKQLRAIQ